ncbi:polysaccharide lyase family 8 super-sandwich domain-containing protein [Phytoactinopolyspora mesophila]|uniref:DNRLRE domain-containing protein n=1 Tax=Phytoactinopolyspora mesophila TaxID=2650750 RepID=A0A7K3M307_9ACTN|nr:polysaccharide lyase family 8 super-sandwich domain-containing protein [Phytoactinopolyspora mesophila]NDL56828.1 DNRLRE domain-containing protein [Phytoactinopolyspora mesophila]
MRSRLFHAAIATVAAALITPMMLAPGSASPPPNAPVPDHVSTGKPAFVDMRHRLVESLTGGRDFHPDDPQLAPLIDSLNADAQDHLDTMNTEGDPEYLWPDMETAESDFGNSAQRLRTMAIVYQTKGAALEGDPQLADAIVFGLDWLERQHYHVGSQQYDNWWWWEIGTPAAVTDALALMYEETPADVRQRLLDAVRYHVPDATKRVRHPGVIETGANRIDKAWIVIRWGLLDEDSDGIAEGRDALSQVFEYVTSGDGFYRDGSFVQHNDIAYTGSYGLVLMGGLSRTLNLLAGTPWEVTDPNVANVWNWIFDSYEPITFAGQLFDHTRGRDISRIGRSTLTGGHGLFHSIANLVEAAPDELQPRIRAYLAEMAQQGYDPYDAPRAGGTSIPRILAIRDAIDGVEPRGPLTMHKQFPAMDRKAHFQGDWAFTVSARSSRIAGYEAGNGENLRGWYTGEGMTYVYDHDYRQYADEFWPTVDPYHLAGTTVATEDSYPRTDNTGWRQPRGAGTAGGAVLGDDGAYGMHFTALRDEAGQPIDLTGKKSWFTLGDTIVALGAGIEASNVAAQTTVENRMVPDGGTTLTVDGDAKPTAGMDDVLDNPSWLHLDGAGGYLFPSDDALRVRGEARTGRWSDIGANLPAHPDDEATREYATFWFDHGDAPTDASYAYYLLPGRTAGQTEQAAEALAAGTGIQITGNTADVQSVIRDDDGTTLLAANYWTCATAADLVHSYHQSAMVLRQDGDVLDISVSDPTQQQQRLVFDVARDADEVIEADPRISVLSTSPLRFAVDTEASRGASFQLSLRVDPDSRPELPAAGCQGDTFDVQADTYVRGGAYAGQSFNGQGLVVKQVPELDWARQTFLRFDLTDMPEDFGLATLRLYGNVADDGGNVTTHTLYEVPDNTWDEETLTWNTKPELGDAVGTVTMTGDTPEWYGIDVSDLLQERIAAGEEQLTVALAGPGGDARTLAVFIRDRESGSGPQLQFQ